MSEKKAKPVKYITPKGVAVYPWLNKPDTKFKPEGEYRLGLRMSAEDAAPLIEKLEPLHAAAVAEAKKNPKNKNKKYPTWPICKPALDDNGDETGEVEFSFKRLASGISKKDGQPWSIVPDLFNAKGEKLSPEARIFGGSIVKVAFTVSAYDKPVGNGISLRLEGVQVIKLVEGEGRSAASYGFADEGDDEDADAPANEDDSNDDGDEADADGGNADEF